VTAIGVGLLVDKGVVQCLESLTHRIPRWYFYLSVISIVLFSVSLFLMVDNRGKFLREAELITRVLEVSPSHYGDTLLVNKDEFENYYLHAYMERYRHIALKKDSVSALMDLRFTPRSDSIDHQ
jgi:hypothetical protein